MFLFLSDCSLCVCVCTCTFVFLCYLCHHTKGGITLTGGCLFSALVEKMFSYFTLLQEFSLIDIVCPFSAELDIVKDKAGITLYIS